MLRLTTQYKIGPLIVDTFRLRQIFLPEPQRCLALYSDTVPACTLDRIRILLDLFAAISAGLREGNTTLPGLLAQLRLAQWLMAEWESVEYAAKEAEAWGRLVYQTGMPGYGPISTHLQLMRERVDEIKVRCCSSNSSASFNSHSIMNLRATLLLLARRCPTFACQILASSLEASGISGLQHLRDHMAKHGKELRQRADAAQEMIAQVVGLQGNASGANRTAGSATAEAWKAMAALIPEAAFLEVQVEVPSRGLLRSPEDEDEDEEGEETGSEELPAVEDDLAGEGLYGRVHAGGGRGTLRSREARARAYRVSRATTFATSLAERLIMGQYTASDSKAKVSGKEGSSGNQGSDFGGLAMPNFLGATEFVSTTDADVSSFGVTVPYSPAPLVHAICSNLPQECLTLLTRLVKGSITQPTAVSRRLAEDISRWRYMMEQEVRESLVKKATLMVSSDLPATFLDGILLASLLVGTRGLRHPSASFLLSTLLRSLVQRDESMTAELIAHAVSGCSGAFV